MEHHTVRLPYAGPYDWTATLAFLAQRAIEGVEQVSSGIYRRTIRTDDLTGTLEVAHDEAGGALLATVCAGASRASPRAAGRRRAAAIEAAIARVRRMFDLDADLPAIAAHLARDPSMAALVAARPALRVFRGWDGFEVAARSVIGQQVTVARARQLNGILVDRCGSDWPGGASGRLRRMFPAAQHVVDANLSAMGMPGARVATLKTVARAALADPRLFDRAGSIDDTIARLRAIRGVGDWTAHYIAMRACGEPDAFPASDIGLLRGAADASGNRPTAGELLARAEAWRPWRAYAAHQLWARDRA
jgi:AraC family transcriptional regulator of adaptative response / DNA-3-methyladenine glycosylase II